MFPRGSLRLVEKIYKGTTLADYFNRLAAFALERAVAMRLADLAPGEKICVLEVGAGTGSTTEFVAAALERHGERIDYVYVVPGPKGTGTVKSCERVLDQPKNGIYASDHMGVMCVVALP